MKGNVIVDRREIALGIYKDFELYKNSIVCFNKSIVLLTIL